jgi:hypothetical protein
MPRFDDNATGTALQKHNTGHFGFSAVKIADLQAQEYTLVTVVVDRSGSTASFQKDMEAMLKTIVETCRDPKNPRADNILLRVVAFENGVTELLGWQMLPGIDLNQFDDALNPGGLTALCDGSINGIEGIQQFGRSLLEQDYQVNGILFVITDGAENASTLRYSDKADEAKYVREARLKTVTGEFVESMRSILIAVNSKDCARELADFNKQVGFDQYIEIENADKKTLLKLADFVSQSISSQSQALGSGGPSKAITPTF